MFDRRNSPVVRPSAQLNQDDLQAYASAASFQTCAADMDLKAGAGKDASAGTAFLAAVMGNLIGDDAALTKTGNYLGGGIFLYSVPGAQASHYPTGACLAGVGDGAGKCDGAVVAFVDGDSGAVNAGAMFKVRCNNSTAASGADFGLDLQDAAHDGFIAVDKAFYKKAHVRLTEDVCVLTGSATPTDGVTGATFAGGGSMYVKSGDSAGVVYINTGTKASPTWKSVTHA